MTVEVLYVGWKGGRMSKLKVADFYYGAVLSTLFNHNITPALVESSTDRQVYDFTTFKPTKSVFRLFVKYRAESTVVKTDDYYSWTFTLDTDYDEIMGYINDRKNVLLALVCGKSELGESELAVIRENELLEIFKLGKRNITISRRKHERAYRISVGGGRSNAKLIKCNALDEIIENGV